MQKILKFHAGRCSNVLHSRVTYRCSDDSSQQMFGLTGQKPQNIILIRHAESIFNAKCHKYPYSQLYSKQAQQQFHHDPQIIDCALTERGFQSVKEQQLKTFFKNKKPTNTIFFASPMLRTLQTTQLILQTLAKPQPYQVKVIPQLSEVLSKICDFSSGINDKKEEFVGFDFRYFDEWNLENGLCEFKENWQDPFLDNQLRTNVDTEGNAGKRYLNVLKQVFPKPLENAQKCRLRSVEAFKKILQVSKLLEYKNAVIISHNRILKNIQAYIKGTAVQDFQNLQIRQIKVPKDINDY